MAVEIKELVVRAVAESAGRPKEARRGADAGRDRDAERDALVAACVREVLAVLRRERER